jgi:hypothetical protein
LKKSRALHNPDTIILSTEGIMGKGIDISGQRFGRLIVLGRSKKKSNSGALWECTCDCGGSTVANSLKLRNGLTSSCGCYRKEILNQEKHGFSGTRTHRSWKEMRNRCRNEKSTQWKWYGGRGIKICDEWNNFEAFLADMGERPVGKTLDRLSSDGNYCKENCRWATPEEQASTNRGCFKKVE